jgi:hypothetical protein
MWYSAGMTQAGGACAVEIPRYSVPSDGKEVEGDTGSDDRKLAHHGVHKHQDRRPKGDYIGGQSS